jgi:hypothetical protein
LRRFEHIGDAFVGSRIASGMGQQALARQLGIHERASSAVDLQAHAVAPAEGGTTTTRREP